MPSPRRVALVGAGYISAVHAEALRLVPGVELTAVVDPNLGRANALADQFGIPHRLREPGELAGKADVAHVLVPPDLHRAVAEPLLRAGLPILLEKPLAASAADARALVEAAAAAGVPLGVNQNFVYQPAFLRLRQRLARLGRLHHVAVLFNLPLRQLQARQFSHWMFREPVNILLEQAVHPLSQIVTLVGPLRDLGVTASDPRAEVPGGGFRDTWQIAGRGGEASAGLFLSLGQTHPVWVLTAIASDGVVSADMVNDRVTVEKRSKWPDFYDSFLAGTAMGGSLVGQSAAALAGYVGAKLHLCKRNDPFFRSMRGSIAAFHAGLGAGRVPVDGAFGANLVALCERAVAAVPAPIRAAAPARAAPPAGDNRGWDIALLGGTGFIGTHLVRHLLQSGKRVAVMARSPRGLPPVFDEPGVVILPGDVHDRAAVERTIGQARTVINLAQGAGGQSDDEIVASMRSAVDTVAEACLANGVTRLVYLSSIAALYLGDGAETVTGATPADPQAARRSGYARGKAEAERRLLELRRARGLPVVIVRPGVVVGEGGLPFHGGLGFFNAEAHCLGWNRGTNPLPFVLVEDVATAVAAAAVKDGIDGRAFNLVGDVRLSAAEYVAELARVLGRPLVFHPQSPLKLVAIDFAKYLIKRATGRSGVSVPSLRDFRSRGLVARLDCADAKAALDWHPVADRETFLERSLRPFAP